MLLGIGQDPGVSSYAHQYILMMMPSVFLMGHIDCMKRFLNAMNVTYVPMIASIITSVMHLGFLFLFVTVMEL